MPVLSFFRVLRPVWCVAVFTHSFLPIGIANVKGEIRVGAGVLDRCCPGIKGMILLEGEVPCGDGKDMRVDDW